MNGKNEPPKTIHYPYQKRPVIIIYI